MGARRYNLVYNDNVSGPPAATSQILQSMGVQADYVYGTALKGFAALLTADAVACLRQEPPRVKYVREDGIVHTHVTQSPATWGLDRVDRGVLLGANQRDRSRPDVGQCDLHQAVLPDLQLPAHPDRHR